MRQTSERGIAVVLLIAAMGLGAGCPIAPPDSCTLGTQNCPCTSSGACDPGLQCRSEVCIGPAEGLQARDAGPPPIAAREGSIGSPCAQSSECRENLCLSPDSLPGGYCSRKCGGGVLSFGEGCPEGAACTQFNEATSVCLALCGPSLAPCRQGYVCAPSGSGPDAVCRPRCTDDRSCRPGEGCNVATGTCQVGARAPGGSGAACADNSQCAARICLTEAATRGAFPGGYCTRACTAAEEDRACANDDGICLGLPKSDGTKTYTCFGACTTGVDCRSDYVCSADASIRTAEGKGVCVPRCDIVGCATGFTCDPSVGICTRGAGTGGPTELEREELGTTSLGSRMGDFKTVSVQVPEGVASFSLVGEPLTPGASPMVVRVTTPNGQVVYDYFDPTKTAFTQPHVSYLGQPLSLIYPNAPRVNIQPGRYEVVLGATAATEAKITVLHKRQSGVAQGGTLPVTFWFTKQKHLTAQTAQTDRRFQAALQIVAEIYSGAGVKLGPFIYRDVPGPSAEALAVISETAQMATLFAHANSSPDRSLNFFFIDQFNFMGGAGAIGISGGIPGPPGLPGLPHGGVAVALEVLEETETMATAMAHEGGHYLGLFHTSERTGLSFDPLLDTPECPASANTNGDKVVDGRECLGKGSDNLMFWTTSGMPQRQLSGDQRFVVLRNPVIQ